MIALDLDRVERLNLAKFLAVEVFLGPVQVTECTRATGGLSWETFFVQIRDGHANVHELAVRRAPKGGPLAPYLIEPEVALLQALATGSTVRVPRVLCASIDTAIIGRPFIISEMIHGESPDLRRIEDWSPWRDEAKRAIIADGTIAMLAAIQGFEHSSADLHTLTRGGGQGTTQRVAQYTDFLMSELEREVYGEWAPQPICRDVHLWLKENVIDLSENELVLVHGDFRLGNFIWQDLKLAAVVDWERATIGDPMQDLGFFCLRISRQRQPELMGMLCTLDELERLYVSHTGREFSRQRIHFYSILSQFVEATLVPRGLSLAARDPEFLRGMNVYPQLNHAIRYLVSEIEAYEDGIFC